MSDIEALAWELLDRIDALHKQGKLSKAALLGLNDPATELRRALMRAATDYALSGMRVVVRESEPGKQSSTFTSSAIIPPPQTMNPNAPTIRLNFEPPPLANSEETER
jgi:hypothetical protein